MFENEGLTIVYRDSPAALNAEEMPLKITSPSNKILLSRCGLVILKNADIGQVRISVSF